MKLIIIKLAILLLCVPAYPFIVIGAYVERRSYSGSQVTFRKVNRGYWSDVKDALIYRKEGGK